ncbi:pathogenicity island 1 effector protein SopD, partial [Salmonella enterica subsp. enterica serovar Typhimurium]
MPVTLSFGTHQNYTFIESPLPHLLSAVKEKAIHMGGWAKVQ